jgi:ankyrin repeat protein
LALCLKGKYPETQFYNPVLLFENIFMLLVKSGSDVNFVYPEELYKPAFKDEELIELDDYDPNGKHYSTPLINVIRNNATNEILRNNIIGLIEYGAKLNVLDSDGRDPIMHAVITNNTMVVKILLENKKVLNVNPNH